jgi:hypothetical protein
VIAVIAAGVIAQAARATGPSLFSAARTAAPAAARRGDRRYARAARGWQRVGNSEFHLPARRDHDAWMNRLAPLASSRSPLDRRRAANRRRVVDAGARPRTEITDVDAYARRNRGHERGGFAAFDAGLRW